MSEEYEVRGVHEEVVEHHAEHREPLAQQIALFSAVLATMGEMISSGELGHNVLVSLGRAGVGRGVLGGAHRGC